jgi:hypothetical protein
VIKLANFLFSGTYQIYIFLTFFFYIINTFDLMRTLFFQYIWDIWLIYLSRYSIFGGCRFHTWNSEESRKEKLAGPFIFTFRYIDDVLSLNNYIFFDLRIRNKSMRRTTQLVPIGKSKNTSTKHKYVFNKKKTSSIVSDCFRLKNDSVPRRLW